MRYMLLVTGSLAFDHIMNFPGSFADHIMADKLHILNVSFLTPQMHKSFGGTAGNIAYSLALLGVTPTLFAVGGKDFAPYKAFLEEAGVDTHLLRSTDDHYTSTAFAITDKKDNQIWGFYPGADELTDTLSIHDILSKSEIRNPKHERHAKPEKSKTQIKHSNLRFVSNFEFSASNLVTFAIIAPQNPRAMMKYAKEYTHLDIPYLFDPGMQLRWLEGDQLKEAFKGAKIIIGNDYEVAVMEKKTGIASLHDLAKEGKIIITTLGEQGSKVSDEKTTITVSAVKLDSVLDPSGAGDAYRSGFVAGFMKNLPIKTCAQMGSVAAAYTVEAYGTVTHAYDKKQFAARYKKHFKETISL